MPGSRIQVRLSQPGPIPLDVDIACNPGEVLAITGPSGSGKTTTLRAIAGLCTPAQARITVGVQDWLDTDRGLDLPPQRRSVGMVFQNYALFPHLSARHNVVLAVGDGERASKEERADALLSLVNMDGLGERRPHELSGGQQQRVALARALARDPEVLLLDEPFAAVDQQTRRKLTRELARLRQGLRMPVILVTHDLDEARMLADQISVIHHGRTLQTGAPVEVMARPVSALVARLVGLDNVFTGTIDGHDEAAGTTYLKWSGLRLETALRREFVVNQAVDWMIPAENIILHRRDRPSRGERENPVSGSIDDLVSLGEYTALTIQVAGGESLYVSVPTHVARRNDLARRGPVTVSLLAETIHIVAKDTSPAVRDAHGFPLPQAGEGKI